MKVKRIISNTTTSETNKAKAFYAETCSWIAVGFKRTVQMQR